MGLEDVKNEIIQQAHQEEKQIINEAEATKKELLNEAEDKAENIIQETENEIEEEKSSMRKKAVSNANMEGKKTRLEAKQEAINEAFDKFADQLTEMDKEEKTRYLKNAKNKADFEVGKVQGSSDFKDMSSTHEFEEIDKNGIILVSENGKRRLNLTFQKIRQDFEQEYRKDVAQKLFD